MVFWDFGILVLDLLIFLIILGKIEILEKSCKNPKNNFQKIKDPKLEFQSLKNPRK